MLTHCPCCAEYVAGAVREQNSFLDAALQSQRFWHLWNGRQSEEALKSVHKALTEAFGIGMHTATVQVRTTACCHAALRMHHT